MAKVGLAKVGLAKVGRITMAKVGLAKVGFDHFARGHVLVFTLQAARSAAPSLAWLPWRGVPSVHKGDTMVVSIANCAPWKSGKPSTHHLQFPTILSVQRENVEVPHYDTGGHSRPSRRWPRTSRIRPHRHLRVEGGREARAHVAKGPETLMTRTSRLHLWGNW